MKKRKLVYGFALVLVVLALITLLYVLTEGILNRALWVGLWAAIALATGISFWTLTDSEAEVELPKLGIKRLTGGAGVGVAMVLVISWLVPSDPQYQVYDLPSFPENNVPFIDKSTPSDIEPILLPGLERVLVEWKGDAEAGSFELHYLDGTPRKYVARKATISRAGNIEWGEASPKGGTE